MIIGLGLFRHLTFRQETVFGTDISSQEYFGMGTFQCHGRSGTWTFCLHGHFGHEDTGTGTFWHGDIMALGHFGTKIFQHMDILAQGHL